MSESEQSIPGYRACNPISTRPPASHEGRCKPLIRLQDDLEPAPATGAEIEAPLP